MGHTGPAAGGGRNGGLDEHGAAFDLRLADVAGHADRQVFGPGRARAGGRVVYATCSILPEEGEQQVQRFLAEHPSFRLVAESRSMPDVADEDGFYRATLERTDDA